jgi:hypothetical protein
MSAAKSFADRCAIGLTTKKIIAAVEMIRNAERVSAIVTAVRPNREFGTIFKPPLPPA